MRNDGSGRGVIRVLIADDSALLREALSRFLAELPDVLVVGESRDGGEALALASALRPDIVLMDLAMPGIDGLAATRLLKATFPSPLVVICTLDDGDEARAAAHASGADALVRKRDLARQLEGLLLTLARPEERAPERRQA
jgi:DNA-binding NarL/FixJ family response regulator